MQSTRVSDQLRRKLLAILEDDRPDAERLLNRLRDLRRLEAAPTCATALQLLAHLDLGEPEAERLLVGLLRHRDELSGRLGRDPGLRVAACDYLSNVNRLLVDPTIVERAQLERTERSAITDALTRLYNRRHFMGAFSLEIRRSHRYGLRMSLLMLDLDEFKRLNDHHGHLFGDLVLQRVGQLLRRAVREADLACRLGGEEFGVILPETDRLGAWALGERVRRSVGAGFAERPVGGKLVRVTLSGGIAAFPDDGHDPSTLMARADQALYLSKQRGKDRVSAFHSERRRAFRYPAKSAALVSIQSSGSAPGSARLLNVSSFGALVEIGGPWTPAETAELVLGGRDAAGRAHHWSRESRIVRLELDEGTNPRTRVALEFDRALSDSCLEQQIRRSGWVRAAAGGAS